MIVESLRKAVAFHLDRTRDHTVQMVKTILDDPRTTPEEQVHMVMELIHEHLYITTFLEERVIKGLANRDLNHKAENQQP